MALLSAWIKWSSGGLAVVETKVSSLQVRAGGHIWAERIKVGLILHQMFKHRPQTQQREDQRNALVFITTSEVGEFVKKGILKYWTLENRWFNTSMELPHLNHLESVCHCCLTLTDRCHSRKVDHCSGLHKHTRWTDLSLELVFTVSYLSSDPCCSYNGFFQGHVWRVFMPRQTAVDRR